MDGFEPGIASVMPSYQAQLCSTIFLIAESLPKLVEASDKMKSLLSDRKNRTSIVQRKLLLLFFLFVLLWPRLPGGDLPQSVSHPHFCAIRTPSR